MKKQTRLLKLEELAHYLPYGLIVMLREEIIEIHGLNILSDRIISYDIDKKLNECETELIKPLLKPLSNYKSIVSIPMNNLGMDVSTQIELTEFANKEKSLGSISYKLYEEMCRNHIDFNGLIESGLALDINTL